VSHYGEDLAWIHHAGFSDFATSAAAGVIALLRRGESAVGSRRSAVTKAPVRVVDLGCGSGVLARALCDAGYDVLGIDPSAAMIDLARANAPAARFEVGRFEEVTLPPCLAITALGEVLNHATLDALRTFFSRIASGTLVVFDVAEAGPPIHDERRLGGDDWSVIVINESDGKRLTRRVLTFRDIDGSIRRSEEVHTLELYTRDELLSVLREHGFRVRVRRSYGSYRLPRGHAVYVAQLLLP
jgi:SAM-dependent methyltransferase